jgi:DNA-binding GntR family transcriptional regulator
MQKIHQPERQGTLDRRSLADQAYLRIRERILRGQLRLGAVLSRRSLAAELGMSLIPVTEALQRLESDGLIESRPRAGTRVRVPTDKDVREHYEIREALESQSARLFAERATAKQKEEIRRLAEHLDVLFNRLAAGNTDPEFEFAVHSFHAQFHLAIAERAGCEALRVLIEKNQVLILNWLYDVAAHRRRLPPTFHRDLTEVLVTADPLAADQAMREHVRYGLEERVQKMRTEVAVEWRLRQKSSETGSSVQPDNQ